MSAMLEGVVVFDASGGAAGIIMKQVLRNAPHIDAFYVNAEPDGTFALHDPNPLAPRAMETLSSVVVRRRSDVGIIFDADGDRMFAVDNNGRIIDPDVVAYFLATYLKPKTIVHDLNTGFLIRKGLKLELGTKMKEERVGHYFIKKTMRKMNAGLGVEHSGHYYFKDFFFCDSGLFAAVSFLSAMSRLPYRLSDFISFLPPVFRIPETNFKMKRGHERAVVALNQSLARLYPKRISRRDGLRMEFNDWWFSVRPSNTEPLIRLNLEASGEKELKEKEALVARILRPFTAGRA